MRVMLVFCSVVALAGCKKKNDSAPKDPDPVADGSGSAMAGSGSGSAMAGSGSAITGSGSAMTGSGSAMTGSGSAAPTTPSTVISSAGVGPLTDLVQGKRADEDEQKLIEAAVKPLGLTVSMEVMDMPGDVETEEGYFSVKKGDTEVLQIFRGDETAPNIDIHVVDPMFATGKGVKVGDAVSAMTAAYADAACTVDEKSQLGMITCRSASEKDVTFVLDAQKFKGKNIDLAKESTRKIVEIVR